MQPALDIPTRAQVARRTHALRAEWHERYSCVCWRIMAHRVYNGTPGCVWRICMYWSEKILRDKEAAYRSPTNWFAMVPLAEAFSRIIRHSNRYYVFARYFVKITNHISRKWRVSSSLKVSRIEIYKSLKKKDNRIVCPYLGGRVTHYYLDYFQEKC